MGRMHTSSVLLVRREAAGQTRPAIVFLDIGLPDMNRYGVARHQLAQMPNLTIDD